MLRYGVFLRYEWDYSVVYFDEDPADVRHFPKDEVFPCSLLDRIALEVDDAERYEEP